MTTYNVWVTLVDTVEADNEDEAFDHMLDMLDDRTGMEISSHEIIEEEK